MMNIKLSFTHMGTPFDFDIVLEAGVPYRLEIGEAMLCTRVFECLVGLDKNCVYEHGFDVSRSPSNNVLALGDKTMFIRGDAYRNVYKALRTRFKRKVAKQHAGRIIAEYNPQTPLEVALARASMRDVKLVVVNRVSGYIGEDDVIAFTKFNEAYIIEVI
ncbi:MAG: hypothetical protein FWE38_01865 [Firmicutes bacterium]|nr:hypothetical protein [Bacillota bacterium]